MQTILQNKVSPSRLVFPQIQIREKTSSGRVRNQLKAQRSEHLKNGIAKQHRLQEHKDRMAIQAKNAVDSKLEREAKHRMLVEARIEAARLRNTQE